MITRYALFEGQVHPGQTEAFRDAVMAEMLPVWKTFPGALSVRVTFAESRDEGAPEYPLILAINYADQAAVDAFMAHPVRMAGRAATESVLARFFSGRIHHHVTTAFEYPLG
jgi:quinol monooxygenase YgiN